MIFNLVKLDSIDNYSSGKINPNSIVTFNDSQEIIYYDLDMISYTLTDRIVFTNALSDIQEANVGQIYILPDGRGYKYTPTGGLISLTYEDEIFTIFSKEQYRIVTLTNPKGIAPVTTASQILFGDGADLETAVNTELLNIATKMQATSAYVEAVIAGQTVFAVPFPTKEYDMRTNYVFVLKNGEVLTSPTDFTYDSNNNVVLTTGLNLNEKLVFIFTYITTIDPNGGLVIFESNLDVELAGKILMAYHHATSSSNPHGVTKAQIGLGDVENYGIATDSEALEGVEDNKYMTPAKMNLVIRALKSEGFIPSDDYMLDTKLYKFTATQANVKAFSIPVEYFNPLLDTVFLYHNGLQLHETIDYTRSSNTITITFDIASGDSIICESMRIVPNTNNMSARVGIVSYIWTSTDTNQTTIELPQELFTTSAMEIEVFHNGLRFFQGINYAKVGRIITLDVAVPVGEKVYCNLFPSSFKYSDLEGAPDVIDTFTSTSATASLSANRGKLLYDMIRFGFDFLKTKKGLVVHTPSLLDDSQAIIYDTTSKKVAEKVTTEVNDTTVVTTTFYGDDGVTVAYALTQTYSFDSETGNYIISNSAE